jgi:hypothetical protein
MTTRDSNGPLRLLLLAQLLGVDRVAGRHVRQHPGHSNVPVRPFPRLGRGRPASIVPPSGPVSAFMAVPPSAL